MTICVFSRQIYINLLLNWGKKISDDKNFHSYFIIWPEITKSAGIFPKII